MRRRILGAAAALGLVLVAGCSEPPPHNVDYYTQHDDERTALMRRCAQDQNTENPIACDNAANAQRAVNLARLVGRRAS